MGKHRTLIIGESGGTKTDWRIVSGKEIIDCSQSKSYHPARWSTEFWLGEKLFWQQKNLPADTELWFFGSGCMPQEIRREGERHFQDCGFRRTHVFSDLDAAALALFGNRAGLVCILGTGSVCAQWNGREIAALRGGRGFLLDDPGSGYYFGKRLLQEYLDGKLPEDIARKLGEHAGTPATVKKRLYADKDFAFPGMLAAFFPPGASETSDALHLENLRAFLDENHGWLAEAERVGIVGSYGFYLQDMLRNELPGNTSGTVSFLKQPADRLTDYLMNHTF